MEWQKERKSEKANSESKSDALDVGEEARGKVMVLREERKKVVRLQKLELEKNRMFDSGKDVGK